MNKAIIIVFISMLLASYNCAAGPKDNAKTDNPTGAAERRTEASNSSLTGEEAKTLLAMARDTLKWCVGGKINTFTFDKYSLTQKLQQPIATFVTLRIGPELQGRAGSISSDKKPVYESVHDNVVKAVAEESMTNLVALAYLSKVRISIALVESVRPIRSIDEFNAGEHGIVLEKGVRKAVSLPEDALAHGWNREQTMDALALMIGKGRKDDWRRGARYRIFSTVVLSE